MRTALFWAIMQLVVVIPYQHFKTAYWSVEDWTDSLSQNISKELPLLTAQQPIRAQLSL
jgi:hypothetical protein